MGDTEIVCPSGSLEGTNPFDTLTLHFCLQNCGRMDFCCLRAQSVGLCYTAPGHSCDSAFRPSVPAECPPWGMLSKHGKRQKQPPSLHPWAFFLFISLSFALWSLHILISYPSSLHLRVQKCGFQSKGHLENSYTKGCKLKFQSSAENSGKEFSYPRPPMPSPSSSLEPPHFAITLG